VIDVIVIGGGFAGLTAGVALAAEGFRVTVLEKRQMLGGRAYSYTDTTTGETIDNGQHAMMGCYHETLRFLAQIGASDKLLIQSTPRITMLDPERGAGAIDCPALPNPLHMAAGVLGYGLLGLADRARVLIGGLRLLAMKRRGDARLATLTVAEVLARIGQTPAARRAFWDPLAIATLNEDPNLASADLLAEVLVRAFFSGKDDARFILSRVGLSELYTTDARRFIEARGGTVETKAHVVFMGIRDNEVTHLELRDGRRVRADAYVSAMPPQGLAPVLPAAMRREIRGIDGPERLTSSPIVSVHAWLDRPVLTDDFVGLVGTTTHWIFNRDAIAGRRRDDGCSLAFVTSGARDIVDLDNERIVEVALADLRRAVPAARDAVVRHVQVVKEKFATMSPTVAAAQRRPAATTPLVNLVLAGDWTDTGLPATIESAVQSGYRAAVLAGARVHAERAHRAQTKAAS
jgi:squalene-associated FAD-dependent desaturase